MVNFTLTGVPLDGYDLSDWLPTDAVEVPLCDR